MTLTENWVLADIEETLLPFENGQTLRQGWSPQCENFPAKSESAWGVLKTTAIQDGDFQSEHNKQLPSKLDPDPPLEVQVGDLLLTCAGPRVRCGVVCLVRKTRPRLMVSGKMYRFRSDPKIVLPEYLESFLRSHDTKKRIDEMKTGISDSGLNITLGRFKVLKVPIPPSAEQKRIVAKIEELFSELDKGIETLKTAKAQLAVYRKAMLKAACEGKLIPTEAELANAEGRSYETGEHLLQRILTERRKNWTGRGKYKDPALPDTANLPELPEGWVWSTIDQLGEVQLGRQRSPKNVSKNFPTKYIRAANITEQGLRLADVLEMEFTPEERERFMLREGDIVLSEASGSASQVGKPAIWQNELALCCFQNTVIRLRPFVVNSRFALTVLKHFYSNGIFAQIAGGVGINHLGAEKFSVIPFPLPPLSEQKRIVEEFDRCLSIGEKMESSVWENIQKSEVLRQSILKKAFAGELVPQDPSDEPASVLLERIRSERAEKTPRAASIKTKTRSRKPSTATT